MSEFFDDDVTRVLPAKGRQFTELVWHRGKPPLDSEFNLMGQVSEDARQSIVSSNVASGWIGNVSESESDFEFDRQASNMFWLGKLKGGEQGDTMWANVNGWLIPVTGTKSSDARNAIMLPPPQGSPSDSDVNFVFLEVWKAVVSAAGSVNKPSAALLYKYGNVEYGGTNVTNDLLDPAILFETTKRVQLQYRIRVVSGVNPTLNPHGFGSAIKAQGALDNPSVSTNPLYQFSNMGEELGDPGLWRSGDGDGENGPLKTVDGYTYAIPLCMVFRRTTLSWNVIQQNGAFNRNPAMTDRLQASVMPTITLTTAINATELVLQVSQVQAATTLPATNGLIQIEGELMKYSTYTGNTITVTERGSKTTHPTHHAIGAEAGFVSGHPQGYFSDQIVDEDVLDLRHIISLDGLDYDSILRKNFDDLLKGDLNTTWKKSSANLKGRKHFQVDYFGGAVTAPDYTTKADVPDGHRRIFSDACALQPDNLLVLGSVAASSSSTDLTLNASAIIHRQSGSEWYQNDVVLVDLDQFRGTFPLASPDNRRVRFVHPFEYDNSSHKPVRIWYGGETSARTLTSLMAAPDFMVLGTKMSDLSVASSGQGSIAFTATPFVEVTGVVFSPTDASDMIAADAWLLITSGTDTTSSNPENHGAFRIIGINGSGHLEVEMADGSVPAFSANTLNRTWSIRLAECHEDDTDMAVVLVQNTGNTIISDAHLFMTYDLLYHPGQGLARVPEHGIHVELDAGVATDFVRENDFSNPTDSPSATVKKSPLVPMMAYPHDKLAFKVRNVQNPAESVEGVWAEAYMDRGSKTLVYQPLRNVVTHAPFAANVVSPPADITGIFNVASLSANACALVAKELRPSLGRLDLPFVTSIASVSDASTAPAYGVNCMLLAGSPDVNTGFVRQRVLAVYDPVNLTSTNYGEYRSLNTVGAGPAIQALVCRYYNKGGVRGIELPANYGIARLFAAHTQEDFYTVSAGNSVFSAGSNYRVPSGVVRDNILRTDGERRSLIITDDNTFVIPEDVLDQKYFTNDTENQAAVFELDAFFFDNWAQDVMRIHRLNAIAPVSNTLRMFVNGPASSGDEFFVISTRTPYQGSIYGTMPTATLDAASLDHLDYTPKHGVESPLEILDLLTGFVDPDATRVSNQGVMEILAAIPFATTLGTGVMSGEVVPGSFTDTGYLNLGSYPFTTLLDAPRHAETRLHPYTPTSGTSLAPTLSDALTGVTERLPMGLMVGDSQFLGEGLGSEYKRLWTPDVSLEANTDMSFDRTHANSLLSGVISFSDGTSGLQYESIHDLYRTYRGGVLMTDKGGTFTLSGGRTFKDLPYINTPAPANLKMHGAVLFGVAFLVRNAPETVTTSNIKVSAGDEVQMMIVTGVSLGKELDLSGDITREFVDLLIQMHPSGAGEGYCAADRYRVHGRPLQKRMRNISNVILPNPVRDVSGPIAPPTGNHCP